MSYEALIEDLVATQTDIFGAAAVEMAADVEGLELGEDGTVERLDGDGVQVVEDLVSTYVSDLGGAATVTLKSAAGDHADRVELPAALQ